jgi:DNA-binding HxlR family transcriptional regulator
MADMGPEELVHYITQKTRGRIIQDILGHPWKSPSFDEIDYMNPEVQDSTLRQHINGLIEKGLVKKVETPTDLRDNEAYTFFTLTDKGREILEKYNLYVDEEKEIEEEYAQVDKPDYIQRKQKATRPPEIDTI